MTGMRMCALLRAGELGLPLAALAAAAVQEHFTLFEVLVGALGALVLAASAEVAFATACCSRAAERPRARRRPVLERPREPQRLARPVGAVRWRMEDLYRNAEALSGRDPYSDARRSHLLARFARLAGSDGILPAGLDDLVRDAFPELVRG